MRVPTKFILAMIGSMLRHGMSLLDRRKKKKEEK